MALAPSEEVVALISVAFRVIVNGKQIVGSVVLPNHCVGYLGAHLLHSDVKGWVFEQTDGMAVWWPSFRGSRVVRAAYEDEGIWNEMATVVLTDALRWESKALHPIE
ncbi:hypothetical protein PINS_up023570 [Pythium insidiosum]|nr:hypothetical protein PINS_up023570 [Pythium insidiosum]